MTGFYGLPMKKPTQTYQAFEARWLHVVAPGQTIIFSRVKGVDGALADDRILRCRINAAK
jgi:hypothetical protein